MNIKFVTFDSIDVFNDLVHLPSNCFETIPFYWDEYFFGLHMISNQMFSVLKNPL